MKYEERAAFEQADAFGIGAPNDAYAQYFVGDSFLHPLTDPKECPRRNDPAGGNCTGNVK